MSFQRRTLAKPLDTFSRLDEDGDDTKFRFIIIIIITALATVRCFLGVFSRTRANGRSRLLSRTIDPAFEHTSKRN